MQIFSLNVKKSHSSLDDEIKCYYFHFMDNNRSRKQIPTPIKELLWGKAAGRCEMTGCNKLVYESHVTYDEIKLGEIAHNIAASKGGPRGDKDPFWHINPAIDNEADYNAIDNLLLLCPECHAEVDKNRKKYPVELLCKMKKSHEDRIRTLTSITDERECILVSFSAPIAKTICYLAEDQMLLSLADSRYFSAPENRIDLSQTDIQDGEFVSVQKTNLKREFTARVEYRLKETSKPVALFSLAPIPLLVLLGSLFPTGTRMFVFQKLRNPIEREWYWAPEKSEESTFKFIRPVNPAPNHIPCLALEGTGIIADERINAATKDLNEKADIWRIQAINWKYDLLCSEGILREWNTLVLQAMNEIRTLYGHTTPVRIFPAINNALAVETGIARLEKIDPEWVIYDNLRLNGSENLFVQSLSIGGED